MGLLARFGLVSDSLWLLYIFSIVLGIPLWAAIVGVALLRQRTTTKLPA
jgi:hypothetical protein